MTHRAGKGFTLIELVITIAVLAVMVGWAIPSFFTLINQNRLTSTSNQMLGLINQARSEALRKSDRIWVSPLTGTDWGSGAAIWLDVNGDGLRSDGEIIRLLAIDNGSLSIAAPASALTVAPFGFDGAGFAIEDQPYTLTFCSNGIAQGQLIEINAGGQIRASRTACGGGG